MAILNGTSDGGRHTSSLQTMNAILPFKFVLAVVFVLIT
jgi:hypothetical protein